MSKNERCEHLVKQLQEQIFVAGSQVKQKMKAIQMDLLAEIGEEQNEHPKQNGDTLR